MNNNEKFTIHVNLNGLRIPLTIKRKDELLYRNAEKIVKKTIEHFTNNYPERGMEEILTFVSFQLAVKFAELHGQEEIAPLAEMIEKLNNQLKKELDDETPGTLF